MNIIQKIKSFFQKKEKKRFTYRDAKLKLKTQSKNTLIKIIIDQAEQIALLKKKGKIK